MIEPDIEFIIWIHQIDKSVLIVISSFLASCLCSFSSLQASIWLNCAANHEHLFHTIFVIIAELHPFNMKAMPCDMQDLFKHLSGNQKMTIFSAQFAANNGIWTQIAGNKQSSSSWLSFHCNQPLHHHVWLPKGHKNHHIVPNYTSHDQVMNVSNCPFFKRMCQELQNIKWLLNVFTSALVLFWKVNFTLPHQILEDLDKLCEFWINSIK